MEIRKVAVLGSGVMGSTIAAHFANAGIPSLLLDILPAELTRAEAAAGLSLDDKPVRNRFAAESKMRLLKAKPAPLFVPEFVDRIEVGNFSDDLFRLKEVDWVIEAVVEKLEVKQKLMEQVAGVLRPGTLVSTNTSGISLKDIAGGLPEEFCRNFLGTHFFNPPRYMKLLEVIPGPHTDQAVLEFIRNFGERVLGKGVIPAKDTPNFIANRIGVFGLAVTVQEMVKAGLRIDQVDALTGPVMGRPKSASFRTVDMVGLDTFVHVANNIAQAVPSEKERFVLPPFVARMLQSGLLGDKTGRGFYRKVKGAAGSTIEVLDYNTMNYVPTGPVAFEALEQAHAASGIAEKLRVLLQGKDPGALFAWKVTKQVLLYAAEIALDIAGDIAAIDEGMRLGFNWQLGPFEIWDALGVKQIAERMLAEGSELPSIVKQVLTAGGHFYRESESGEIAFFSPPDYKQVTSNPYTFSLKKASIQGKLIYSNAGAKLVDMGDGVACLEFRSPNNSIGPDIVEMVYKSLAEVEHNYQGLVIGNQGKNFCVGANLMLVLLNAEEEDWDDLELMIRQFQQCNMAIKYAAKPVVAAPFGMTLGGGTEICLHCYGIHAAAETYMGLVELGVGLIPAGGGCKEMAVRAMEGILPGVQVAADNFLAKRFEYVAMAKVSTSAEQARQMGFLRYHDAYSMNSGHVLLDAKAKVLELARNFRPKLPEKVKAAGRGVGATLELALYTMHEGRFISAYDALLGRKLAYIFSGGNISAGALVDEQHYLDLEREAFLSLAGEPKTQERIRYMLSEGKPLRN